MVNGDLTRYPEVGCPWGARTGEPRAKAEARYCEPGWGPTEVVKKFILCMLDEVAAIIFLIL